MSSLLHRLRSERGTPRPQHKRTVQFVPPHRLRIGNRQAAAGVLWQPARSGLSLRDQVNLASGERSDLDLFTTFGSGRQFGFASSGSGFGSGMMAAATAIDATGLGSTWLATFELAEGGPWWIVAMRSGLIYEDQICEQLSTARSTHQDLSSAPEWEHIVAPESWRIPSADARRAARHRKRGDSAANQPPSPSRHGNAGDWLCMRAELCRLGNPAWLDASGS